MIQLIAKETENWSASDVCALCKEAAMAKLRLVLDKLEAGSTEKPDLTVGAREVQEAIAKVRPSYDLKL